MNTATEIEGEKDTDFLFKIVVVGDTNVGKTNIISRFTKNEFDEGTKNTIGVDFSLYDTKVNHENITIQFWDTAGQEKYRAMSTAFYKKSHGAIIVYDVTNRSSFTALKSWLKELRDFGTNNLQLLLLGNKIDLENSKIISKEEGHKFAKENKLFFMEVSAKINSGRKIEEAMKILFKKLIENPRSQRELLMFKNQLKIRKNTREVSIISKKESYDIGSPYVKKKSSNKTLRQPEVSKNKCCLTN